MAGILSTTLALSLVLSFTLPAASASRTAVSISRCEVTPTTLRNLRKSMLKRSSSMLLSAARGGGGGSPPGALFSLYKLLPGGGNEADAGPDRRLRGAGLSVPAEPVLGRRDGRPQRRGARPLRAKPPGSVAREGDRRAAHGLLCADLERGVLAPGAPSKAGRAGHPAPGLGQALH